MIAANRTHKTIEEEEKKTQKCKRNADKWTDMKIHEAYDTN